MDVKELKAKMGWVTCPKDKVVHLIDLHCTLKRCNHFRGEYKDKIYCTFEEGSQ